MNNQNMAYTNTMLHYQAVKVFHLLGSAINNKMLELSQTISLESQSTQTASRYLVSIA
ncbi:MAG: hypothetical protein ACKO3K_08315 [Cuspidothrix sp.]